MGPIFLDRNSSIINLFPHSFLQSFQLSVAAGRHRSMVPICCWSLIFLPSSKNKYKNGGTIRKHCRNQQAYYMYYYYYYYFWLNNSNEVVALDKTSSSNMYIYLSYYMQIDYFYRKSKLFYVFILLIKNGPYLLVILIF